MTNSPTVLLIEDSKFFARRIKDGIESRLPVRVIAVDSLAEAKKQIAAAQQDFFMALVDIVLPDSQNGEAVDLVLANGIPTVVFSSIYSPDFRSRMLNKQVIDYVIKNTPSSLGYLFSLVEQLFRNRDYTVLVVDDSKAARHYLTSLLKSYQLQVIEADNGDAGLAALEANPHVTLVLCDYQMREMDGVEMVRRLREKFDMDRLAVIGISSSDDSELSARFLKHGANDFIAKPFQREEFFCRLMQNLRMIHMMGRLKFAATRDFLTGLYNRRHFFDAGERLMADAAKGKITLTAAMLDVDFFKKVNDTYGHDGGDVVLKAVADTLSRQCRPNDLLARLGGEEFAILCPDLPADQVADHFNSIRQALADAVIPFGDVSIPVTASFGVCVRPLASLDKMLETADRLLYQAKQNGRNRVELGDG